MTDRPAAAGSTETGLPAARRLYTIGHSDRSGDAFIDLLHEAGIALLVDVRSFPGSRHCPQFARAALEASLPAAAIDYLWLGRELGGLRKTHAGSPHVALRNASFRGYADFMEGELFQEGIERLLELAERRPTAIMCAERRPEQCHRSMISDLLAIGGVEVTHLVSAGETRPHRPRPEARCAVDHLVYDRVQGELL